VKQDIFASEKAVSSVIGMILIFGITIISISAILLYSVPTMEELQDMAQAQKVEQAFTVFDSRTSKVALGESPIQTTYVSLMGGTITINGDADAYNESSIVIVSVDIAADEYYNYMQNRHRWRAWKDYTGVVGFDEFNCSLGTIEYRKGDRIIAYEGGGVWSKYPTGGSVMVSPPEFHYNGETLTLPIMKINGRSSVSGMTDAGVSVSSDNMPVVLFPNTTLVSNRTNPVDSDKVIIYIKSEFYDAWADYANTQAYTTATVDDANRTAIIELEVIPPQGTSSLTDSFKIGVLNETDPAPLQNFSFNLVAKGSQGLNPSNYEISASSGTKTLTYTLDKKGANQLVIEVTYEDSAVGADYIEHWDGDDAFDVTGDPKTALIDFLDDTFNMTYDVETNCANPDFSWNNTSQISIPPNYVINNDNNSFFSLNDLTQHYLKLLTSEGSVLFTIDGGPQDPVDYSQSTLTLAYDGMSGAITYLHVTRNDLDAVVSY